MACFTAVATEGRAGAPVFPEDQQPRGTPTKIRRTSPRQPVYASRLDETGGNRQGLGGRAPHGQFPVDVMAGRVAAPYPVLGRAADRQDGRRRAADDTDKILHP